MESLLTEEQVLSCQISVTAQKNLTFWSDRWITPECLQEVVEAILLVVAFETQLCKGNVRSHQMRVTAEKGYNFWSDRWIVLKFL